MKSIMNHNFSQIPAPQIQRSTFDRSSGLKTSFNSGFLVPIFTDEVLPGDTIKMDASFLGRLSTFIFPIMDNIFFDTFWFFVPSRLLWTHWEKFNGAQDNPGDSIDYTVPSLNTTTGAPISFATDTIYDYFGLPNQTTFATGEQINALPFRAYNLIWNDWFRDENLQNSVAIDTGDGPDALTDYVLLHRGKRHDYFSSCLPFPQKGTSVALPLGTTAPVIGDGFALGTYDGSVTGSMGTFTPGGGAGFSWFTMNAAADLDKAVGGATTAASQTQTHKYVGVANTAAHSHIFADLTNATAATVNQLRQAFAYQKILERDARGGTRYVEMLKSHFGVTSPDFRLQRPEYLGGSSQRINVAQVQQTSQTDTTPQGNLAAYVSTSSQARWTKSFVEHGYIIGLANVRADITYQNGLHKMWSRKTRFDFYLPALAHLGEQAVLKNEIFYQPLGLTTVFGYQERWAEYRYKPSFVTSRMRSNVTGTLDSWHLALDFGSTAPSLNDSFIQDNPPIDRVIAVSEGISPQVILDCYFSMRHTRPMPTYSVPGQIDRF